MNAAMLFITPHQRGAKLGDVASGVFRALAITDCEERDSANYPPDDHYFAGYCENAEVTVYNADDDRTPDYPFRVSVEDSGLRKGTGLITTDVTSVARALMRGGFTVFVPTGDWERTEWDGDGDVYAA